MPELASDSRFADNTLRSANREQLKQIIDRKFTGLTAAELTDRLDEAKIACANVNDMAAVWEHPQLRALGRIEEIGSPAGALKSFRPPGNNNSYESPAAAVPALGEHTAVILTELGFDETEIARFKADAII